MNRYFFSRRKGEYWIMDRQLDTRIAKTDWRESAGLICSALNENEVNLKEHYLIVPHRAIDAEGRRLSIEGTG